MIFVWFCDDAAHFIISLNQMHFSSLVDGGWSPFNAWGPCSVTCSDGIRERTRTCTNPAPSGGGTYCLGCSSETELCVNDPCPGIHELNYE